MITPKSIWYVCVGAVIVLCSLCFTPIVIPKGESQPLCFGLPRTLWLGILIYAALVLLTFIASRVYSDSDGQGEEE